MSQMQFLRNHFREYARNVYLCTELPSKTGLPAPNVIVIVYVRGNVERAS